MHPLATAFVLSLCSLLSAPAAQDGPPQPAPELKKLEPLVGNWQGSGTFQQAGATSKWKAMGSYRWSHGGFFLQEDFAITFEGNPAPLVFRAYVGWDAERRTYVNASVNNGGEVQIHDMTLLPDGTLVQVMVQHQQGTPYAERTLLKVDGDKMTHTIDLLMPNGPSSQLVDGTFTRVDADMNVAMPTATFGGAAPHESMKKLSRLAGAYAVQGSMVMMPGQPATKITGTETFRTVFAGTALHGHADGAAEGMPGKYEADAYWAYSAKKNCLVCIYVSNMGEVGTMEGRFTADGKALVTTQSATMQGEPMVNRYVMSLDGDGRLTRAAAHMIYGTLAPYESFQVTYTKK